MSIETKKGKDPDTKQSKERDVKMFNGKDKSKRTKTSEYIKTKEK